MSAITQAIYERLSADATLVAMLTTFGGQPAIFTSDPPPGSAELPYIVSAGEVSQAAFDTKTTLGRRIMRDVRCYTAPSGSDELVESIAERVRALLHRHWLVVAGFGTLAAECSGPVVADERDAQGRIVTVRLLLIET